jgi:hypothetical protein
VVKDYGNMPFHFANDSQRQATSIKKGKDSGRSEAAPEVSGRALLYRTRQHWMPRLSTSL